MSALLHPLVGSYIWAALPLGLVIYCVVLTVYRLYFHPLSRFPGPLLHRVSRIPYFYRHINGTLPFDMLDLHLRHGNIVRIAPDELAFSHPDAWNDIQGHHKAGKELTKADWFYNPIEGEPLHIVNESRDQHARLRRQMAHGFSERSMRDQEPLIRSYVDLLVRKLREKCENGENPVVMSDWYNFTTFDVIGDLAFGEAFGCLEQSGYDAWIKGILAAAFVGTYLQALAFVPRLKKVLLNLVPRSMREAQENHKRLTRAKMLKRMESSGERPDLIEGLLRKKEELSLSVDQLVANAEILIIGGSETTATLLSGVTFYLLTTPSVLTKLTEEVRSSFESEEAIDLISVGKLTYMLACLNEGLRMYSPVANGLPRVVPEGGTLILNEYIPANTCVAIHHWALYRREAYFTNANEFHPERFLGDPLYKDDRTDALQPFSVGPRNCLGRNLAYSEMRLILARIIYNFDMKIAEESRDWIKQRNYLMWKSGPLKVHLIPVKRH